MKKDAQVYRKLDRPEIVRFLFHPRPEFPQANVQEGVEDCLIPVESGVAVGGRFFPADPQCPNLLFFHGNGEIVADYDDVGRIYQGMGINFFPVDYRGYGRSTGSPTVSAMMNDCHLVLEFFLNMLAVKSMKGPLLVMGRSLGSASALELTSAYAERIDGLVIESGFARTGPLLELLLGYSPESLGIKEEEGFGNLEKIRSFRRDTLIIHGEEDDLIPADEGRALYEASGAARKNLLLVPGARHNDLFVTGFEEYLNAVRNLAEAVVAGHS
jgi:alpha-beta hydrolase superfamily lysophospholipase